MEPSQVLKPGGRLEDAKQPMTLRHLVMHTSGLGYGPSRERKSEKLSSDGETEGVYMDLVKRIDSGRIKNLKCFCNWEKTFRDFLMISIVFFFWNKQGIEID